MRTLAVVSVLLLAPSLTAQNAQPAKQPSSSGTGMEPGLLGRIPIRMQQFVDDGSSAGFVTLIEHRGHIVSLQAVGYRDMEAKAPMQVDTIFRIKSMTKPMTAAGIMILVDQGRLSLLDPIEKFLPEFKGLKLRVCGPDRRPEDCQVLDPSHLVTVRDLLTHTSGLRDPYPSPTPISLAARVSAGGGPLVSEPGTVWRYSNLGFATLGRLIEVISGQPYDVFMSEHLFGPLGMKDTHYFLPTEKLPRLSVLYTRNADGKLVRATEQFDRDTLAKIPDPEGGLFSTAVDQSHFYQMLLDKGIFEGKRILSVPAVEAMTNNQTGDIKGVEFSPGLGMGFGLGVVKDPVGTYRYQSIGSFLKGGAYRTLAWGDPTRKLVGVIMYQRTNGGGDTAEETNVFVTLAEAAVR